MEALKPNSRPGLWRLSALVACALTISAASLYADDSPLVQRQSHISPNECIREMRAAAAASGDIASVTSMIRNPLSRLSGAMRLAVQLDEVSDEVEESPDYVSFQILPGKAKLLNQSLTQAEVNAILNELRARIYHELVDGGFRGADINMIFKGVYVRLPQGMASTEAVAELETKANEAFHSIMKERFPYLIPLYERMAWSSKNYVKAGVASTPYRALLSSRHTSSGVSTFKDEQDSILENFDRLLMLTQQVQEELLEHPRLFHLLSRNRLNEASLSEDVFDALRKSSNSLDVYRWLQSQRRPPGEGPQREEEDLMELADNLWIMWNLMKAFAPPPQFRSEDYEAYDPAKIEARTQAYYDASHVLVADLVGAGGRVMKEFYDYLRLSHETLELTEDPQGLNRESALLDILDSVETPLSVQWIHQQLDLGVETIRQIAGDKLLDLWVTGDEIHLLLSDSHLVESRRNLPKNFRLSENATRFQLGGETRRVDEFLQSLHIKISETAQKWPELSDPSLGSFLLGTKIFVDPNGQLRLELHFWDADLATRAGLEALIRRDLLNYLSSQFPSEDIDAGLVIHTVYHD